MTKFQIHLVLFLIYIAVGVQFIEPAYAGLINQAPTSKDLIFACEDKENYPFIMGTGENIYKKKPGVSIEILKKVEEKLNINIKFVRMPWKRALSSVESGSVDGLFEISFKEERKKIGAYPMKNEKPDKDKRFFTAKYVLYTKKDSPVKWDGQRFFNVSGMIGAPLGYSIADDLKDKNVKVEASPSTKNDMKKLLLGRIDGAAALEYEGDNIIKRDNELQKNIKKHEIPLAVKDYYLIFSRRFYKKDKKLAQKIWDEIEAIREKELDKIMGKYYE
ncbi:MAG: transporter substrate-binding domain-containing protein [Deltaproteobacteria bacterium]|nr:transporter substrate-binding domain-containing protein [Deltaproteobacteria bacterium]